MWQYISTNELTHGFKYIKKIKTGSGTRYFYTQAEIDAYNNALKRGMSRDAAALVAKTKQSQNLNLKYPNRPIARNKTVSGQTNLTPVSAKDARDRVGSGLPKAAKKKPDVLDIRKKAISDIKREASKTFRKGQSKAEKLLSKIGKNLKAEVAGAKRAANIWKDYKYKKGDKAAIYMPKNNDKYYLEAKVTKVKNGKNGYQEYWTDKPLSRAKKKKTTRLERASLRLYRATHPYE